MAGNLSKTPRFVKGVVGPKGDKGDKGDIGETPVIRFKYDESTGKLYYSTDGIAVESALDEINGEVV